MVGYLYFYEFWVVYRVRQDVNHEGQELYVSSSILSSIRSSGVVGVKLLGGGVSSINGATPPVMPFSSWSGTRVMS